MTKNKSLFKFLLIAVFIKTSFLSYSQETDTIKINITNTQYDTVQIFDTTYFIDTIYTNRLIDGFDISPSFSPFGVKWRTSKGITGTKSDQNNYSLGLEVAAVKDKYSFSGGFFFSKIQHNVQFGQNITTIDTTTTSNIVQNSYFDIDTTGSEWQFHTYDSIIDDSTTIIITDSILIHIIDSTEIFFNDTILTTAYDTISFDTLYNQTTNITYFDIPVIFRYQLYTGKNVDIFAGTGLIVGILRKHNIYYLSEVDGPTLVREESQTKILPSIWLSGKITYYPLPSLGIFAEPYYTRGVKSMFNKDFDVISIPDRYGIRFGLTYLF